MIRVAINGFGRIGRALTKLIATDKTFKLVAVNDLMGIDEVVYLLKYDSINSFRVDVDKIDNNTISINGQIVQVFNQKEIQDLKFPQTDIVFECSGVYLTKDKLENHLINGAKKVILSAPPKDKIKTIVLGVNSYEYDGEDIVSNASCTTNCVAPIVKILDDKFGVIKGSITTTHSYTNDQNLIDSSHNRELRRARASALNIIPTTTGISSSLAMVMPNMSGRFEATSLRVPIANVSIADLNILIKKNVTIDELNSLLHSKAEDEFSGILEIDRDFRVSSDILLNPHSSIIAQDLTKVIDGNFVKIMSWYDNEWGYSNRLIDLAKFIFKD